MGRSGTSSTGLVRPTQILPLNAVTFGHTGPWQKHKKSHKRKFTFKEITCNATETFPILFFGTKIGFQKIVKNFLLPNEARSRHGDHPGPRLRVPVPGRPRGSGLRWCRATRQGHPTGPRPSPTLSFLSGEQRVHPWVPVRVTPASPYRPGSSASLMGGGEDRSLPKPRHPHPPSSAFPSNLPGTNLFLHTNSPRASCIRWESGLGTATLLAHTHQGFCDVSPLDPDMHPSHSDQPLVDAVGT